MPTNQEARQASVRAATSTAYDYNGDWSALFDMANIPAGGWNGRMLAWINQTLSTSYTELNGAMAAFAISQGADSWNSLGTFSLGPSYDPAAVAYFARIPTQTADRYTLLNTVFVGLRAAGLLSTLDCLWLMAAADATTARTNLISSSFTLSAVNGPTFTTDRGYNGDGASSYLNTGFNPATAAGHFSQNNGHISVYDRTSRAAATVCQIGSSLGSIGTRIFTLNSGSACVCQVNNTGGGATVTDSKGFYNASRPSSSIVDFYLNGVKTGGDQAVASGAPYSGPLYLSAENISGAAGRYTSDQIAQGGIGGGMTDAQAAAYYSIIQAYMTGVGANV